LKKFLLLFSFLLVFGVLAACSETDNSGDSDNKAEDVSEDSSKENATEESKSDSSEEADKEDESVKEFNELIVDNENVKATLIKVERTADEIFGDTVEITFEVENKREDSIEVQAASVSADGKMIDEALLMMSQEVAPGKLADATLTIQDWEGGELPPMEDNIELSLSIFSWDDYEFQEEHPVTIDLTK
jgi:cytoskeletal protein RodZ